jgi:hypothetical protein
MRCLAIMTLVALLSICRVASPIEGIPVRGHAQAVSSADIQAAVSAVRAENPPARTAYIREIRVVDSHNIYLITTSAIHGSESRFEAKRTKGHWHYTNTYIGPP